MQTRISAQMAIVSVIAQSSAVPHRMASPPVVAASATPMNRVGNTGPLLLERLYVRDHVPDFLLGQLGVTGHRRRLADGLAALVDRLEDLRVVHALEPAAARRPVARLVLELLALRAVAGAGVAVALRALLIEDRLAGRGVALALR